VFKPTLPVAYVEKELGFESTEMCLEFLTEKLGQVAISGPLDAQLIDTASARAQKGQPTPVKAKADWATGGEQDPVGEGLPTGMAVVPKRKVGPGGGFERGATPPKPKKPKVDKKLKKAGKAARRKKGA